VPIADSIAVGALLGILYLAMAPPVYGYKDSSEFTLALATGGVPHPTGYAIYAMLGHAFMLVAHRLGARWPYAANAWSAAGGAVAAGFLHALAARLIPATAPIGRFARSLIALIPASLFGLSPIWVVECILA
jgi:hypothetical protein